MVVTTELATMNMMQLKQVPGKYQYIPFKYRERRGLSEKKFKIPGEV